MTVDGALVGTDDGTVDDVLLGIPRNVPHCKWVAAWYRCWYCIDDGTVDGTLLGTTDGTTTPLQMGCCWV